MPRESVEYTILNAKGANGAGNSIFCKDFRHAVISVATDGGGDAAMALKFQGSIAEDAPTFSSAQSVTNHWDYIEVIDLEDGSAIDGDTGITIAGDDYRILEMNVNALDWITAIVSSRTEGEVTVKVVLYNN